jgi:hypothetical protein
VVPFGIGSEKERASMRNLSRVSAILSALLGVSGVLAFAVAGCGGDDSVQGDSGGDTSTDGNAPDGKRDGSHKNDAPSSDVVGTDSPTPTDSPADSPSTDGGTDSGGDLAALYAFPAAVNAALCTRLATCCAEPDAGVAAFVATCVQEYAEYGGVADVNLANTHGGHIKYDSTAAAKCFADIKAISCGSYTSAEEKAALSDCTAAMVGTIDAPKGGCTSSWECAPTGYCAGSAGSLTPLYDNDGKLVGDAGAPTGTCTALRGVGDSCTDLNFYTDCTYVGNGSPDNFCNPNEAGTAGSCVLDYPTGSAGAGCLYNQQCQTELCIYGVGCESSSTFSDPGDASVICSSF